MSRSRSSATGEAAPKARAAARPAETTADAVAAAQAYETLFVPALFAPWAPWVCDGVAPLTGKRVLDVACGTGVLAREAAGRVGPAGTVAGLDPSPGMLAVAAARAPQIDWRLASAEAMPFADGSFDAVVSQFGLMFFADRHQGLREMLRVLAPGGRLSVAVWGTLAENPAYAAEVELLERVAGRRAADALRAPFVLGDTAELAAELSRAGAESIVVESGRRKARFPSVHAMVEADLLGWLPAVGVRLDEATIRRVLDQASAAIGPHVVDVVADGDTRKATFECTAHRVTAMKETTA
jgi:ubiquinone/menaquinone biosynthesis C-methylase UbiE